VNLHGRISLLGGVDDIWGGVVAHRVMVGRSSRSLDEVGTIEV
jgi:hypothetical protein